MVQYRRVERVLWRYTADGVVLLPLASETPVSLGGSGAALWELLSQPTSLSEAARTLAGRFNVEAETVQVSIEPVLDELVDLGAIERMEA